VNMMTRKSILRMIRIAKGMGARVILGGPEPRAHAREFLERGADVVVVGEGELTLAELIPGLIDQGEAVYPSIRGIIYLDEEGKLHETAERPKIKKLDDLPWPDRAAIDIDAYLRAWRRHHGVGSVSLITARGCPFKCAWCSHAVYGHTHRRRSPGPVVDEIEWILDRYHPEQLWIADDVFTINPRWTRQWALEMQKRRLRTPYECISRADCLTEELSDALRDTGCKRVWFGSESGSQRILDAMNRGVTKEEIRTATRICQARGIEVGLFVMVGYEGETIQDIEETISHLKETNPDTFLLTVAYPIRGTTFHQRLGARLILPESWLNTTDRDIRYAGRRSDRFYRYAVTRIQEELALHRIKRERGGFGTAALKSRLRSRAAKAAMEVAWNIGGY